MLAGLLLLLTLNLTVRPLVSPAPATLTLRIRVPASAVSQTLTLILDGVDDRAYYRLSAFVLMPSSASQTQSVQWRDVPAGEYTATAFLSDGHRQEQRQQFVTVQ